MRHRVYVSFMHRDGWHCSFLESDLKTSLKLKLRFTDPQKLYELADRSLHQMNLEERQGIGHGINIGRDGFYIEVSDEQYQVIRSGRRV